MTRRVFPFSLLAAQQQRPPTTQPPGEEAPDRLPDGRLRSEAILKKDHQDNLADLDEIEKTIGKIRAELTKNDRHVLSLGLLKQLDQVIEKAKRIQGRMRRF